MGPRPVRLRLAYCALASLVALASCGSPQSRQTPRPRDVEPLPPGVYSAYLRGRLAMEEGDHEGAIHEFQVASRAAPNEVYIWLALVEAVARTGDLQQARILAADGRDRWPDESAVWMLSGELYRARLEARDGREDLGRAIDAFERAAALEPGREDAYLALASAYIDAGASEKAERACRRLLEAVPDSVEGHYLLGEVLLAQDQPTSALDTWRRALTLHPEPALRARIEARIHTVGAATR